MNTGIELHALFIPQWRPSPSPIWENGKKAKLSNLAYLGKEAVSS